MDDSDRLEHKGTEDGMIKTVLAGHKGTEFGMIKLS
jgi:hypothetical protein